MSRLIELTRGLYSKIDEDDFTRVSKFLWYASQSEQGRFYAKNIFKRKSLYLHRFIVNASKSDIVDHINGDTLDNRKSNLRIVDHTVNVANQRRIKTNSMIRGVYLSKIGKRKKPWMARLQHRNTTYNLGWYHTPEEAHTVVKNKLKELYGLNHKLETRWKDETYRKSI